jgi:5-methylcytosine-specific restriction endonuclease McrA
MEILGCTFEEFKVYLESKFDENMNWENQGSYWQMDHIIPISSAKSEEDVYRLNHYTNFQPLYWKDNLSKGNKILE